MISLDEVRRAAEVIAGEAVRTPVVGADDLDTLAGATVLAKDESLQRTGSFKFRGAFNRVSAIPLDERHLGVVAVSSGNHGAAVACAAEILGLEATIHVPADVAPAKRDLIEGFGARIVTFDRSTPDREAAARQQVETTGATFVHPFEDRLVMAGQGTAALELHEQAGPVDVLVVPMSGGGLMAGCGSAMRQLRPECELIGVEPAAADDTRRSFAAGRPVSIAQPTTIADGLAITAPGEQTFEINRRLVAEVVTVTDDQLVEAMRLGSRLFGRRYEPSGVAGLAAVVADPARWRGRRVGVLLTGGNIDAARFDELTSTE